VRDGKELTRCAASRNSKGYIALLSDIQAAHPKGDLFVITENLTSHLSAETNAWLAEHPRIQQVCMPKGARLSQSARGLVAALSPRGGFLVRALPIRPRSTRPGAWRPHNSMLVPSLGSGDGLPSLLGIVDVSFITVFEE
jgi:hypothetical protein